MALNAPKLYFLPALIFGMVLSMRSASRRAALALACNDLALAGVAALASLSAALARLLNSLTNPLAAWMFSLLAIRRLPFITTPLVISTFGFRFRFGVSMP